MCLFTASDIIEHVENKNVYSSSRPPAPPPQSKSCFLDKLNRTFCRVANNNNNIVIRKPRTASSTARRETVTRYYRRVGNTLNLTVDDVGVITGEHVVVWEIIAEQIARQHYRRI